ncbi:hypothetical protein [Leptolyngbya sp. BC1307]|uniref:hypothetical protein n=1 Tax=Leptolyngbya sp. BC1307 TaxID=2029589 RepID=UPI000EFA81DF|nr:hypothetical protein [Leptolyngbya sp. BC1307]
MQSFREPASSLPKPSISLPVAVDLTIGLSALPLIALLISSRFVADSLIQFGQASEEIFRGDRLPSLPRMSAEADHLQP